MPATRRRRMMAERAAEGEDAEAEDVPMVESIENLEDTRGRPVREHIMAVRTLRTLYFENHNIILILVFPKLTTNFTRTFSN